MRARRRGWRDVAFTVVDVETTGLDPRRDQLVSFGAVAIDRGRIAAGRSVYGLVRPSVPLPATSIRIHGIRPQDLADAPVGTAAMGPLVDALRGRELVAHAAWVERGFLGPRLRPLGIRLRRHPIDTAELWRLLCIEQGGRDPGYLGLAELTERLHLPGHHPHHALGDALTTAQVFLALCTHLEQLGRATLGDLLTVRRRLETRAELRGLGST
jgi:DNA polymerase III subunit epsilon